jgi:hypothetical protein
VFIFSSLLLISFFLWSFRSPMTRARVHTRNVMHSHCRSYATFEARIRIVVCQFFIVTSMHCDWQMCLATILWGRKHLQRITRFINKQDENCVFCLLCNSEWKTRFCCFAIHFAIQGFSYWNQQAKGLSLLVCLKQCLLDTHIQPIWNSKQKFIKIPSLAVIYRDSHYVTHRSIWEILWNKNSLKM